MATNIHITETPLKKEVIIPSDKNWFLVIVFTPFLFIWMFVEFYIIPLLILTSLENGAFSLVWALGWTAGGLLAIRLWWWHLAGQTVFTIENDILTIKRRRDLFSKAKHFQVHKIENLHIQNRDIERTKYNIRPYYLFTDKTKTVAFHYENKVIRAVDWLNERDATLVLSELKYRLYA